jgi:hypothetical protein
MRGLWLSIQIVGLLLLSTLACSDRLPTEPVPAGAQGTVGLKAVTVSVSRPRRPATRAVAPRATATPQLQGRWGGDNIGLNIESNDAAVEFDCAAGSIDGPFITDSSGRFDLLGSWWFTPPVVFEGWQPEKRPARYSGVVKAGTMTMTVILLDEDQFLGSFTLVFNQTPRIVRCL